MTERWLPIPNYPDYEISDYSRVRSHRRGNPRILKPNINRDGYATYQLCNDEKPKRYGVHYLVLLAFVGPRPEGLIVRHLDNDVTNNHLSNLCYGTHAENKADQIVNGTHGIKLTERKVRVIRGLSKLGFNGQRLSAMFSVNTMTISKVIRRHTWAFVD